MIKPGCTFCFEREILEEDVLQFARLTGDFNPVHMDDNFAKILPHKKRIVHGMLVAAFTSRLIGMEISGPGVIWTEQTFKFISPALIGERLSFLVEILQVSQATKSVRIKVHVQNKNKQTVIVGEGSVLLRYAKD